MSSNPKHAKEISWQEAVARLARERTLAETAARLLKRHGSPAEISSGALNYSEAKAEYDGIIGGLIVALARKAQPASLPDLEARLWRGFEKREAFCESVAALLPPAQAGTRGWIDEAVGGAVKGAVGPMIEAIKALWLRGRDDDALVRKTIETQLETTAWPDFAAIAPEK